MDIQLALEKHSTKDPTNEPNQRFTNPFHEDMERHGPQNEKTRVLTKRKCYLARWAKDRQPPSMARHLKTHAPPA